jgi:hypothetical protein
MKERVRRVVAALEPSTKQRLLPPTLCFPTLPYHQAHCHKALGMVDKGARVFGVQGRKQDALGAASSAWALAWLSE